MKKNISIADIAIAVHKTDVFESREWIKDSFNSDTEILAYEPTFGDEMTPEEAVYTWLNNYYSAEIIGDYMDGIEPRLLEKAYEQMMETIWEIGSEGHATMHYDDPSLIELYRELDELKIIIKEAYDAIY